MKKFPVRVLLILLFLTFPPILVGAEPPQVSQTETREQRQELATFAATRPFPANFIDGVFIGFLSIIGPLPPCFTVILMVLGPGQL